MKLIGVALFNGLVWPLVVPTLAFSQANPKDQSPNRSKGKICIEECSGKFGVYNLAKGLKGCSQGGMFLGRIAEVKRDTQFPERVAQITGRQSGGLSEAINVDKGLYEGNWLSNAELRRVEALFVVDRNVRVAYDYCHGPSGEKVATLDGIWEEERATVPSVLSRSTPVVPNKVPSVVQSETLFRPSGRHITYGYGGQFGKYDVADTAEAYDGQKLIARAQAIALQDSPGGGPRMLKIHVTHFPGSGSAYVGYVYIQAGFGGGRLVREEDLSGRKHSTIFSTWPFGH